MSLYYIYEKLNSCKLNVMIPKEKDLSNADKIFRKKFKNFWVKKTKIVNSFDTL